MALKINTDNYLNTDPRGESKGTYKMGKSTGKDVGYAQKGAFKAQKPKTDQIRPTYRQAKGAKGTKEWSYGELTEEEREGWKVKHGIAPTAADPSSYGIASRAKAKAAKARGELTDKDKRAQGIIQTREGDKAKYAADLKRANWARMKTNAMAGRKERASTFHSMSVSTGGTSGTGIYNKHANSIVTAKFKAQGNKNRTKSRLGTGGNPNAYGSLNTKTGGYGSLI